MIAAALVLMACGLSQEARGKSFDVFGPDREAACAVAEASDRIAAQFRAWFGKSPPRGAILLGEGDRKDPRFLAGGARWTWKWEGPEGAFPHELAHLLLVLAYGKKDLQYGSVLADWIDEGFASQYDPPSQKCAYARTVADAIRQDSWIRFGDLLGSAHPDSKDPAAPKAGDRLLWYAQTTSVFGFLAASHGPGALRDAAERGKLPKAAADLEEEWKGWVSLLARVSFPAEDEIRRWSGQGPEYAKALEPILDARSWVSAIREVEEKLDPLPADLTVEVVLADWEGSHPSAAAREGTRGVVRFNMKRLGDLQRKADEIETRRKNLPPGKAAVWRVPPLKTARLIPHELTHLLQDRDRSPSWMHEGLASWVGDDEHYLRGFAHRGKTVAFVDDPPAEPDDDYARGMMFFRWLEQKTGRPGLRRFAEASALGGGDWKKELEKATGLEWGKIREEEREWSARYLQRFAP
jgi:hypothetical protein